MRVGSLQFEPVVLLAPMEAVTDLPFRTICEELGAALTFTEFLSAEALTRGAVKAVGRVWPSLRGGGGGGEVAGPGWAAVRGAGVRAGAGGAGAGGGDGGRDRRQHRGHQHG